MTTPGLVAHIVAGGLAIGAGFVALYSAKGAPLHRRAGGVFVYSMLVMTTSGALLAALRNSEPALNVPAAVLAAYLVVTGVSAVRPPGPGLRRLERGAFVVALGLALFCLGTGLDALAGGRGGMPAGPLLMFGTVALIASAQDLGRIRAVAAAGGSRVGRHLWRMCFALFIATASFFLGQADEIPKALRIPALLAAPVLAVLLTMLYWMWRYRGRRRGPAGPRPASAGGEAAHRPAAPPSAPTNAPGSLTTT